MKKRIRLRSRRALTRPVLLETSQLISKSKKHSLALYLLIMTKIRLLSNLTVHRKYSLRRSIQIQVDFKPRHPSIRDKFLANMIDLMILSKISKQRSHSVKDSPSFNKKQTNYNFHTKAQQVVTQISRDKMTFEN